MVDCQQALPKMLLAETETEMPRTLDLGRRIELVSMDPHFHNISIALYEREAHTYLVHSYSRLEGTAARLGFIRGAMQAIAALDSADGALRFSCGAAHRAAIRRAFLEACKLAPDSTSEPKPMSILDKKSGLTVRALSLGSGLYEISADGSREQWATRVEAIAAGLKKLAEMEFCPGDACRLSFSCGQPHDALVALLLPRALNVRAALREEEMAASRGVLVAPSAQQ
jgi:hypothetical protein